VNVAFIFEFGAPGGDWNEDSLISALTQRLPELRARRVHGVFNTYRPGGLQTRRLINFLAVYARVFFLVLGGKPDAILVRSTPPGIQLWVAWLARWRKTPVIYWLMDSHPELEARALERRGWNRLARVLRQADTRALRSMTTIVTLDESMAELVRAAAPAVRLIVHPTWGVSDENAYDPIAYIPGSEDGVRRFAYAGNLGAAHDPATFIRVLSAMGAQGRVELHVIGAPESAKVRLQPLADAGVEVRYHPRVPFNELKEVFQRLRLDIGVVILDEASAGLLSPSKFSAYLKFGLPVLYIGPEKTNTDLICTRFGGGWRLPNGAGTGDIATTVLRIWDGPAWRAVRKNLEQAARYFGTFNEHSLAESLVPCLKRLAHSGSIQP
jgi:glycosyltransferase involved in cell wall biosynthesis